MSAALEAALTKPMVYKVTPARRRRPRHDRTKFRYTTAATTQRFYRNLAKVNLRGLEQLIMVRLMNLTWRHPMKNAPRSGRDYNLAPGYQALAEWSGYSLRQVRRVMQSLIDRGFLTVMHGGVGRGNVTRFKVEFGAIREAFALGLLVERKGDISGGAYNTTKVAPSWIWFCGLWGRSDDFRRRFVNAMTVDRRATWRTILRVWPNTAHRQQFSSGYGMNGLEAGA